MVRGKATKKKGKNMKTIFIIVIVALVLAFVLFMQYQKPVVESEESKEVELLPPAYPNPTADPVSSPKLDELFSEYSEGEEGLAQIAPRKWASLITYDMYVPRDTMIYLSTIPQGQNIIDVVHMINVEREGLGHPPLVLDLFMTIAAMQHTNFMQDTGIYEHSNKKVVLKNGGENVVQAVYDDNGAETIDGFGENIHNYGDPINVIYGEPNNAGGWHDSPEHAKHMYKPGPGSVGIGLSDDYATLLVAP